MYKKPSNLSFSDLCIYIDTCIETDSITEENEEIIYKYLVILVNMLSRKYKYFKTNEDYEDFAFWEATDLFMRLKNTNLPKVKSILNYLKGSLYGQKVKYQKTYYSEVITPDITDATINLNLASYSKQLYDTVSDYNIVEIEQSIRQIPLTIKAFLDKKLSILSEQEYQNIYISILLSIIDSITLNKRFSEKIYCKNNSSNYRQTYIKNMFESQQKIILYHLSEDMESYISILIKQLKFVLTQDISYLGNYFTNASDELSSYIEMNQLKNYEEEY